MITPDQPKEKPRNRRPWVVGDEDQSPDQNSAEQDRGPISYFLGSASGIITIVMWLGLILYGARSLIKGQEIPVLRDHVAAIIGIPMAAVIAFAIVALLRQASGPVEFQGLGFRLKGSAGQVVLWVICFLAVIAALKLIW